MMQSAPVSENLGWFCCPDCRSDLALSGTLARCVTCGRTANCLATNLLSFLQCDPTMAQGILNWPSQFVQRLSTGTWSAETGEIPSPDFREQLLLHGVIRSDGALTSLGSDVQYHVSEFKWQAGRKGLDGMLELGAIGPRVRVLDVGCGAAQTLLQMEPDRPVDLVGVDTSLNSLAMGCQFAQFQNVPVTLAMATSYALPFRQGSFDLVLTRVALNYMHQRRALSEMVRVLRPGGFIFCRVERIWHDLSLIVRWRSTRGLVCRSRDLCYGVINSLTGWQTVPGSLLRGGRAFATAGQLVRILKSLGCRVVRDTESPNCPSILGRQTQLTVIAQKEPVFA